MVKLSSRKKMNAGGMSTQQNVNFFITWNKGLIQTTGFAFHPVSTKSHTTLRANKHTQTYTNILAAAGILGSTCE